MSSLKENKVLPDGVEWPRFGDGELVTFGDEIGIGNSKATVLSIEFNASNGWLHCYGDAIAPLTYGEPVKRPEPVVLDADGVPIRVGDTVWYANYEGKAVERIVERIETCEGDEPVKVWFINNGWMLPEELTHIKPDTKEDIEDDVTLHPLEYCNRRHLLGADSAYFSEAEAIEAMCKDLLERQRKLLGGEL